MARLYNWYNQNMKLGYIGLGKMGKNMVFRMLEKQVGVVVWNRSPEPVAEVVKAGAEAAKDFADLTAKLPAPRVVWLMLPAGEVVDEILEKLEPHLVPGDLVIDGGNAFYKDSIRRAKKLSGRQIKFMDIGVSGGPGGARNGACMMIGGEKNDFEKIEPLIKRLCAPGAYAYLGAVGAGHFAKMVHNGIEYGMMQAIAEGAGVLKRSGFNYDLSKVFEVYDRKSVIESRLVGWTAEVLRENPEMTGISSVIGQLGEGKWTVITARELGVPTPVISAALKVRDDSDTEPDEKFSNKIVSALRGKFGGHNVQNAVEGSSQGPNSMASGGPQEPRG